MAAKKYQYIELEKRPDGVAMIWLDNRHDPVNMLSSVFGDELEAAIDRIEKDSKIRAAVLISRKPDNFIVGANINELKSQKTPAEATALDAGAQDIFNRVEACAKPFVAAIHGACMGSGLETVLCCHYRIATNHPKTQLALPEVKLGLMPAAGGTQRLPKLVGLQAALDMMLTGKTVYAKKAKSMGLVDDVVIPFALAEQAIQAAHRLVEEETKKEPKKRPLPVRVMEDVGPARDLVFRKAK